MPALWLQALIVVCAYVAYKGIDYYSLFAVEVYGMSEVEGARVTAVRAWLRPLAALAAGAAEYEARVAALIEEDDDMAEYLERLEQYVDDDADGLLSAVTSDWPAV